MAGHRPGSAKARESADGRALAVRRRVAGPCPEHRELTGDPEKWLSEIRGAVTDESGGVVWLEKIRLMTRTEVDLTVLAAGDGAIADLVRYFEKIESDTDALSDLATELEDLRAKLPPIALRGETGLDLESPDGVRELLAEARDMLIPRLILEEGQ